MKVKNKITFCEASEKALCRLAKELLKSSFEIKKRIETFTYHHENGGGISVYADAKTKDGKEVCAIIEYKGDEKINIHQSKRKIEVSYFIE